MTIEMEYSLMRQQYLTDYQNLREEFLNIAKCHVASSDLNTLKSTYSSVIRSPRTLDYINSIEDLLRILEKRNELSYDNIKPLKHISSNFVKDPILERSLMEYEARNELRPPLELCNIYDIPSDSAPRFESQPDISGVRNDFNQSHQSTEEIYAQMTLYTTQPAFHLTLPGSIRFGPTPSDRTTRNDSENVRVVLLEISEKLGRYWRQVARYLGVKERDIDEIELAYNLSLKEKAFKALQIFQNECNPLHWKSNLKRALDKARRRDLMELVDEMTR